MTPRRSKRSICLRNSASRVLSNRRGGERFPLVSHFSWSTFKEKGFTCASVLLTVALKRSAYSSHRSRKSFALCASPFRCCRFGSSGAAFGSIVRNISVGIASKSLSLRSWRPSVSNGLVVEKLVRSGVSPLEMAAKSLILTLRHFTPILLLHSHRSVLLCNVPLPDCALRPECPCGSLCDLRPFSLKEVFLSFFFFLTGPVDKLCLSISLLRDNSLCEFPWGRSCIELCSGLCPGSRDDSVLSSCFLKGESEGASSTVAFRLLTHSSAVLSTLLGPLLLTWRLSWVLRERCSLSMARR